MSQVAEQLPNIFTADLQQLKEKLGSKLRSVEQLAPRPGFATGWAALDEFLLWRGLPQGALSLLLGPIGLGGTTLWTHTAAPITKNGRWCAWLSGPTARLCPWSLRRAGVALDRLVVIQPPRDQAQGLWALQELLSLSLFDLVGVDTEAFQLRQHQLVKLRQMAQTAQAAVVLLRPSTQKFISPTFALVGEFTATGFALTRALHRPTPHHFSRRNTYEDLMPQLTQGRPALGGRNLSHF